MGMSKRDLLNAEKQVLVYQELIAAINSGKGKEYSREKDALLKVLGGKERLDNIEREEAEAEKTRSGIVAAANKEAGRIKKDAEDMAKSINVKLEQKEAELSRLSDELGETKAELEISAAEHKNAALSLDGRKNAIEDRESALDRRETIAEDRETEATKREAKIKRFNDWRKTAP